MTSFHGSHVARTPSWIQWCRSCESTVLPFRHRSFVREISMDADDAAIVHAIISLAQSLELNVVAEGVDTGGQVEFLRLHSGDEMQGYPLCPPLPEEEATRFLLEGGGRSGRAMPA